MVSKKEFRKWAREHPNFMTPHIVSVFQKGNKFIELSEGRGIEGDMIFGVTLVEKKGKNFKTDTSNKNQMFSEITMAKQYARELKKVI